MAGENIFKNYQQGGEKNALYNFKNIYKYTLHAKHNNVYFVHHNLKVEKNNKIHFQDQHIQPTRKPRELDSQVGNARVPAKAFKLPLFEIDP